MLSCHREVLHFPPKVGCTLKQIKGTDQLVLAAIGPRPYIPAPGQPFKNITTDIYNLIYLSVSAGCTVWLKPRSCERSHLFTCTCTCNDSREQRQCLLQTNSILEGEKLADFDKRESDQHCLPFRAVGKLITENLLPPIPTVSPGSEIEDTDEEIMDQLSSDPLVFAVF